MAVQRYHSVTVALVAGLLTSCGITWQILDIYLPERTCTNSCDAHIPGQRAQTLAEESLLGAKFAFHAVQELRETLKSMGSDLVVRFGDAAVEVPGVAREAGASHVFYHSRQGDDILRRGAIAVYSAFPSPRDQSTYSQLIFAGRTCLPRHMPVRHVKQMAYSLLSDVQPGLEHEISSKHLI